MQLRSRTFSELFNYANFGCDTSCIFDYEKVSSADLKSQISIYTSTGVTILIPCLLLIAILVVTCVTKLSSYQMKKSISDEVFVDDTLDTTAEKLNGHKYELSNGTQFGTDREVASLPTINSHSPISLKFQTLLRCETETFAN